MALYSNLPVYKATYDLLIEFYRREDTIPRKYRYSIVDEIKKHLCDLLSMVYQANASQDKKPFLRQAMRDIEEVKTQLEDSNHVLGEKKGELNDIVNETRQDEEKLREKAKKLEGKIDTRLLTAFKRIRKNAHNGLGVVYVQRYSCGGCFNRIPDQRRMEIKMHKKIIVCEYCGRILIDPEIAGLTDVEAKNVEPTKTKETKSKAKK